ncbi:MAG TPA: alpha/beta hydrolase [Bradyrhizobium sp.]|nr:alpha/beta hydrolase [Bradyrhizobium sp.]
MNDVSHAAAIRGQEHWTGKDGNVKLFMFEKCDGDANNAAGTILFVHGSSMASQPTFDLQVEGRPDSSVMDWFARRGFDCWCVDMEGYGRSTKDRDNNAPIAQGADDCLAAATYIQRLRGKQPLLVYGISSGALRAALFAQRYPQLVARLALDARCGPARARRRLPSGERNFPSSKPRIGGRSIRRSSIRSSIAIIPAPPKRKSSTPSPTPSPRSTVRCRPAPMSICAASLVDPEKITVPTLIMRGQWDGIAGFEDLLAFFARLPNPDKHFAVMPGISHASFQQKNYALVYHILWSFFTQPAPIYRG